MPEWVFAGFQTRQAWQALVDRLRKGEEGWLFSLGIASSAPIATG
jgi:hypothetical protein